MRHHYRVKWAVTWSTWVPVWRAITALTIRFTVRVSSGGCCGWVCCSEVLFERPVIFTNEDYADRRFLHGYCNGSGRLLQRSTGDDKRIHFEARFGIYTEFWEWLVPYHVGARNVCRYGLETMVYWMQGRGTHWHVCAEFTWGLILH